MRATEPFFVVGTGRCGSSLLRRLLRAHPHLVVPNETHWIPVLHDRFGRQSVPLEQVETVVRSLRTGRGKSILGRICQEEGIDPRTVFEQLGAPEEQLNWCDFHTRFGTRLMHRHQALQWGDKTPDYGLCVDVIAEAWPACRFIHLVRDGRDVALSMSKVPSFQQLAASGHSEWKYLAMQPKSAYARNESVPINDYFDLWRRRIQTTTRLFGKISHDRVLAIRYDDLIAMPGTIMANIADFLAVEPQSDWIAAAAGEIRPDNASGNRRLEGYRHLTEAHADSIAWFERHYPSFAPRAQTRVPRH